MLLFTFSVLDRQCPVWTDLVQKVKVVSLSLNLELGSFEFGELKGGVHFF